MKHIAAVLAIASFSAGAQQLSCATPAVVRTAKLVFAQGIIMSAEQQLAIRHSLDAPTSEDAIVKGADKLAAALTINNIRDTGPRGDGFLTWCAGSVFLNSAPQYQIPIEYRTRVSQEHEGGSHTQAKADFPQGPTGFNLLIGMRRALVAAMAVDPTPQLPLSAATSTTNSARPSFDCAKSRTQVERMICSSPTLSRADATMALLHKEARRKTDDVWAFDAIWREWLMLRDGCTTVACLEASYAERIAELRQK